MGDERFEVDLVLDVAEVFLAGKAAVLDDRDRGNGALEQLAGRILDPHFVAAEALLAGADRECGRRQLVDVDLRQIRMAQRRQVVENGGAVIAHAAEHAAMATGRHVAARACVDLHHLAGGKDSLLLQHDDPSAVAAGFVGPDPCGDVGRGIDDVLGAIIADLALWALRRVAADRQRGVDQEIEPVGAFLHLGAALGEDRAVVFAAREDLLHRIGDARKRRARR